MGCDLDKAFSYKTSKVVVIQDRWLGILNLAFTVSILCYIIGYEIIWAGGYLEKDSAPNGIVEMSARMPQDNSYYTFSDLPYCKYDYLGTAPLNQHVCTKFDSNDVIFPEPGRELTITTRISTSSETKAATSEVYADCLASDGDNRDACQESWGFPTYYEPNFIAGVEGFTIRFRHSYQVFEGGIEYAARNADLQGKFGDKDLKVEEEDIFSIEELMDLAGLEKGFLDTESDASAGETHRHAGINLIVEIRYSNLDKIGQDPNSATYEYFVTRIPKTETKIYEQVYVSTSDVVDKRLLLNRHGIKLIVVQGGVIGRFSMTQLFLKLVISMGLLGVANAVTEFLLACVLPRRKLYVAAKQQKTEDFSDVCAREEAAGHRKRQCVCCEILCFKPKEGTSLKKIGGTQEAKDDLEGSPTEPRKETSQVPENEHLPAVPGAVEP